MYSCLLISWLVCYQIYNVIWHFNKSSIIQKYKQNLQDTMNSDMAMEKQMSINMYATYFVIISVYENVKVWMHQLSKSRYETTKSKLWVRCFWTNVYIFYLIW
jgi:hypothetical protein